MASRRLGAFSSRGSQIRAALRQPPAGELECWIAPQPIEVVAVLIAAGDRQDAGADQVGTFTEPLRFNVILKGNMPYRSHTTSRVPKLNDHLFEEAREHHAALVEAMRTISNTPVTPPQFASAVLQVLRSGQIILADVAPEDIRKLAAHVLKKRIASPKSADVLAIPAQNGGFHMAVVLA